MSSPEDTENEVDIVEIEGLLVDTRISDDTRACQTCRGKCCNLIVMSCLHLFCEDCLNKRRRLDGSGDCKGDGIMECPKCGQQTKVIQSNGTDCLPLDFVTTNIVNSSEIIANSHCSNCDSGKLATARCWDCQEFLCTDCYCAHKKLRFLNEHRVICYASKDSSKLRLCDSHRNEVLSLFCVTCEIPVCDKCVSVGHQIHYVCTRFEKKIASQRADIEDLFGETEEKSEMSAVVKNTLCELTQQYDKAKECVLRKYRNHKTDLEEWKEDSLQELENLQTEQELQLAKVYENLKQITRHSEDTCELIRDLLQCGNGLDIMSLKNSVKTQLLKIISNPKPSVDFNSQAETASSTFENIPESGANPTPSLRTTENLPRDSTLQPIISAVEKTAKPNEETAKLVEETAKLEEETAKREDVAAKQKQVSANKNNSSFKPSIESGPRNLIDVPVMRDPKGLVPKHPMEISLEFGRRGFKAGQFESPRDFCLGWDGDIYVADSGNHRIQVFDKRGRFRFQFGNGHGMEDGQLNHPIKVAAFNHSSQVIVADWGQFCSRLQLFKRNGHFTRKIVTKTAIVTLAGLAVTPTDNIVIIDKDKATIMVINESGELQFKFVYKERNLVTPCDIVACGNEYYVCDLLGHAVVVFGEDGLFKRRFEVVLKNLWYPGGILATDDGKILVGYSHQRRFHIVGFNRVGQELFFARCSTPLVSSCCGLQLTPEGYAVTVSKNDNCILVAKVDFTGS